MKQTILRCYFTLRGQIDNIEVQSIAQAKEGFWLDIGREITYGDDNIYWVPPGQVLYVEKEEVTA